MMLRYTPVIAALLASPVSTLGQTAVTEFNNSLLRARIHAGGRIGSNPVTFQSGYFIPSNATTSPLFSSGLWFGGTTSEGQQRAFGHLYGTPQFFSTGPLTVDGSATLDPATAAAYDRFWSVTRDQVEDHVAFFECQSDPNCDLEALFPNGYVVPNVFSQWPAMGNVEAGQAAYLAPFFDYNADGQYDPFDGDHPCLPGDLAIYHIFNDQGTAQNGGSMGLEVHMTVFGYWGANGIDVGRTLFTHYRIINRSTATYTNFHIGAFADFDLGCYSDDRIGTDVGRNLLYVYNGTDDDASCETPGYGEQPPAFGIQVLQGPLMDPDGTDNTDDPIIAAFNGSGFDDGFTGNERLGLNGSMYYNGNGVPGSGDPTNAAQYYNYLRGRWADGSLLTYGGEGYGGAIGSAFAFPGTTDPEGVGTDGSPQAPWTINTAADRKGIALMGPITLEPGAEQEVLLAYVYGRATTGGAAEGVAALQQASDAVASFVENTPEVGSTDLWCSSLILGVQDPTAQSTSLAIYPNPADQLLNIQIPDGDQRAELYILDARGAIVMRERVNAKGDPIHVGRLAPGVYSVRWVAQEGVRVGRFIKQ